MEKGERTQPAVDRGDTTAGGENETGNISAGLSPGSGANAITRAGLRNADPDGGGLDPDVAGVDPADAQRPTAGSPGTPEERERAAGERISA